MNYKAVETYTNGCPSTHPYVYGRGKYCCSSFEFSEWVDKGLSGHIGRSFSNCRGAYTTCPYGENCVDFNQIQIGKRTALKAGKLMTHLTYKLLIYIVDILNNSATVDETKAKRLAGSKSEDRVLTFVPTFRFVADNFLNISKNCYTIRYKNSIIIKLEKCRFCGIGFTLELFCQSRRMMSIHNLPYRIEENITPGGNSGPIGCMERCRDNSDCKVNYFILDY